MLRIYNLQDKSALLSILNDLTPEFFAPEEYNDFNNYLDNELEDYFTLMENEKVVGGGGINFLHETKTARLSWDLIDRAYQGRGLGAALTKHRIEKIQSTYPDYNIEVRTSQLTWKFYKAMQFETIEIIKDYWAKGFDMYRMRFKS